MYAHAELPMGLGGSLTWTSDYVLRGVSQTQNLPAIQADLHVRPDINWTVGAWASTVHVIPDTDTTQLDVYVDRRWIINQDFSMNFSGAHYEYLHDPRAISYSYDELNASAYWADTLYAHISWSPNTDLYRNIGYVHQNQQTLTVEAGFHLPLPYGIDSQVGAGVFVPMEVHEGRYAYASGGLQRRIGRIRLELNYFWVQGREHRLFNQWPRATPWVATATWIF